MLEQGLNKRLSTAYLPLSSPPGLFTSPLPSRTPTFPPQDKATVFQSAGEDKGADIRGVRVCVCVCLFVSEQETFSRDPLTFPLPLDPSFTPDKADVLQCTREDGGENEEACIRDSLPSPPLPDFHPPLDKVDVLQSSLIGD